MTEEIKQPATSTDAAEKPRIKPESLKRKQKRAADRLAKLENESEATKQAAREKDWARNLKAQSAAEKELIRMRAADHNYYVETLLYSGTRMMRDNEPYGTDEVYPNFPERTLAELLSAVAKFPVMSREQEAEGHYYTTFGFEIDGLSELLWNDFLHVFGLWYRQSRNTIDILHDPQEPFSQPDWAAVEALMAKTKLAGIKPIPLVREIAAPAAPPPRRLTEAEQIQKTLNDLNGIGAGEI